MDAKRYRSEPDLTDPAVCICVALTPEDKARHHFRVIVPFEREELIVHYLNPCDESCLPPPFEVIERLETKIIEVYGRSQSS